MNQKSSFASGIFLAVCFGFISACAPPPSTNTNTNTGPVATSTATPAAVQSTVADGDWPGYNRTLTSDRYSPLSQIATENVANLKQVCTFDVGESGNFQSGIIVVNNTLYLTTDSNTIAIDPLTCQQKWKHHYEKPTPEGTPR
jgi:alcohol dehydrogenase (cytochrome c)